MRLAICDDDLSFCERIRHALVSAYPEQETDCFSNGNDLIDEMRTNPYDIAYLDIEMPDINGVKVAEKLQAINPSVIIIFVSSHNSYVFDAFKLNAFQFIDKSVKDDADIISEYKRAVEYYKKQHFQYGVVKGGTVENFNITDIVYIESQNRHLYMHMGSGEVVEYRGKLDDEERKLKMYNFVRVHQSYLVNMLYISSIRGGTVVVDCDPHLEITLTRSYKNSVMENYNLFKQGFAI